MRVLVSVCLFVSVACGGGWQPSTPSPHRPEGPVWTPPVVVEPAPTRPVRTGAVRLEGRAFADDQGTFNALGASLFWALWGERHDPDRLDANLAHLAEHGVDYVRILGMVGSASWADRVIDPRAPDYWSIVDRLFIRLARHGLRAQVTVFADAQVMMPDPREREAFLDAWVATAQAKRDRILAIEIANEAWQNGFDDAADVRRLGDRARAQTSLPVALSAPPHGQAEALYRGWPSLATMHYDRDTSLSDGVWRPVRQPWGTWIEDYPNGGAPAAVSNNEPIGPASSVAADADPLRIALAYVTTFVAQNAAYVYHPGSGIRGGGQADLARGRQANLYDEDPAIIGALAHWRRTLPAGLANWTRQNAQWAGMPWDGSQHAVDRGDLMRAYATVSGDQVVAVLLNAKRPHEVTARVGLDLTLYHPVTGEAVGTIAAAAGERFTLPADLPGYIVRGTTR